MCLGFVIGGAVQIVGCYRCGVEVSMLAEKLRQLPRLVGGRGDYGDLWKIPPDGLALHRIVIDKHEGIQSQVKFPGQGTQSFGLFYPANVSGYKLM